MKKLATEKLLLIFMVIAWLVGCTSTPPLKPIIPTQQHSALVNYALSLQGIPYRYGKSSPEEGFDCSGFVKHVYEHHGISLPRTAKEMANSLNPIPPAQIHPGDLLFFNTSGVPFSHVGIYVKDDSFIHAPSRRTGKVLVSSLKNKYWRKRFIAARRP